MDHRSIGSQLERVVGRREGGGALATDDDTRGIRTNDEIT